MMDKEEAIELLTYMMMAYTPKDQYGDYDDPEPYEQAIEMAIEALQTQKDGDLISKQDAIRWVKTECNPYGKPTLDFESGKKVIEHLEQMPSAETPTVSEKHQLSEETPTNAPTDLISRADVLALAEKGYIISNSNYKKVCDLINELPSADRPSGEWVESLERNDMMYWYSYGGTCTNCGEYSEYLTRYCGDCGAVMYALNDCGEVIGGEKMRGDEE